MLLGGHHKGSVNMEILKVQSRFTLLKLLAFFKNIKRLTIWKMDKKLAHEKGFYKGNKKIFPIENWENWGEM